MVGRTLVPGNYQSGLFNLDRITEEAHIFIVTTRSVGSWKCMVLECKSVGSGFGSCFLIYGVKVSVSEVEGASKSFAWDFYPRPAESECVFKVCAGCSDGHLELRSTL